MSEEPQAQLGRRCIVTTDELIAMLSRGERVELPEVSRPADEILSHYAAVDGDRLDTPAEDNPIVSIEYVRDDLVQCIRVEDERHLYLTDDFIPTHNTSNIVFLKSTDDAMMETLEKMSGKRHVVRRDSKTVTKDVENLLELTNVEGKVSYTMTAREEPVISFNDLAFMAERQSVVFRAGDSPVWNRNETILPMSWRLFQDTISLPGREFTLQTIPTLSTAGDYDPRRNQPDFPAMLERRIEQGLRSARAQQAYREAFGYTEVEVTRLDPDVYSDTVMELIDRQLHPGVEAMDAAEDSAAEEAAHHERMASFNLDEPNGEVLEAVAAAEVQHEERERGRYAGDAIGRSGVNGSIEQDLLVAYRECAPRLWQDPRFRNVNGGWALADGTVLIERVASDAASLQQASQSATSRVFAEPGAIDQVAHASWRVTEAGYAFLRSLPDWRGLAAGDFDRTMAQLWKQHEQ